MLPAWLLKFPFLTKASSNVLSFVESVIKTLASQNKCMSKTKLEKYNVWTDYQSLKYPLQVNGETSKLTIACLSLDIAIVSYQLHLQIQIRTHYHTFKRIMLSVLGITANSSSVTWQLLRAVVLAPPASFFFFFSPCAFREEQVQKQHAPLYKPELYPGGMVEEERADSC